MAMGHDNGEQPTLFITYDKLQGLGHPFYEALDKLLRKHGFDRFAEKQCQQFYAEVMGRPGLAPGVYFRCLLIGYFEGIGSERGIAWRIADSLSLRRFLGLGLEKQPPDHSTISRTRRRLSTDVHERVFTRVLELVAEHGLLRGKTLGIDATTLEANAALRSIVRRDDGRAYKEYLTDLAEAEGIEEPTREDLARLDRKRPKKGSNDEWVHPHDPEAQIMKMKNGSTHLAHKHEQAVDLETGAIVGVTVHGGAAGDTKTLEKTLEVADANLAEVRQEGSEKAREQIAERVEEVVADKGYHSNDVMTSLEEVDVRGYIPEPARGRRQWEGKQAERDAVRRNRRRMKRSKGKELQKKRSELVERPFAHMLDSGGMRRVHVRGHDNILKRLVIHAAGFNLSLIMRMVHGIGKPKALQGLRAALSSVLVAVLTLLRWLGALFGRGSQQFPPKARPPECFAYPRLT
jgi:transposase